MINIKLILITVLFVAMCSELQASGPVLTEEDLVYTHDQMLHFSIEGYFTTNAPHLIPQAETVSHWAGFSSISPKILIALMEHQSSIISVDSSEGMYRPFAALSDKIGFNEQLKDVSNQLAELHYAQSNNSGSSFSVVKLLSSKNSPQSTLSSEMSVLSESFSSTYYRLFPTESH